MRGYTLVKQANVYMHDRVCGATAVSRQGIVDSLGQCAERCAAGSYFIYGTNGYGTDDYGKVICISGGCDCECEVPGSNSCSETGHLGFNVYTKGASFPSIGSQPHDVIVAREQQSRDLVHDGVSV